MPAHGGSLCSRPAEVWRLTEVVSLVTVTHLPSPLTRGQTWQAGSVCEAAGTWLQRTRGWKGAVSGHWSVHLPTPLSLCCQLRGEGQAVEQACHAQPSFLCRHLGMQVHGEMSFSSLVCAKIQKKLHQVKGVACDGHVPEGLVGGGWCASPGETRKDAGLWPCRGRIVTSVDVEGDAQQRGTVPTPQACGHPC